MAQNPTDGVINLTADDLNPAGVNDAPSPNRVPPGDIDISQDVEQGPTAPTPGPKDIQTTTNPKKIKLPPPIVSPTPTVPMFAPDGTPGDVPSEKVHEAIANGGSIGVPVLAPDGTHGIVPAGRLHEALKAGGKIDSSGWTPDQLNANPTIGQRLEKTITGPGMVIDPDALKNSRNVELSKMSPIQAAQEIHQAASIPLVRPDQAMTPEEQQTNPTMHAGLEFAGGLSSPENLAIMIGSGGLGKMPGAAPQIIGKALSAGFSLQVIAQTAQESPKFMEALARGDENEAKYELTKMVLGLGMAEQGAEHVGTNEATGEKAFNPNLGTAVGTSADALVHAAGEYGGKALEAAGKIPGVGLAKTAGKMVAGAVAQPINAMTEGPEAKITRAAGGSAGVQERDFQENIPRAMKYIVDENKTNPIKTPEDMAEAAHTQKTKLWDEQLAKPHPGETIDGDAIAQKLKDSVNPATRKHDAALAAQIDKWADTFKGPYGLDDAMGAITKFNSDLRNFYKQSPSDQFRMAQADPKLGMLQDAADTLRDAAFAKLSELGEKNIPELRKDYGALNQMQRIFEKRAVVYGRQAPIDFKSSLGAIAAVASGHPLAAAVPYLTKYLNSPEYLLQSALEKAGKAAEAGKPGNQQIEQPNRPVNEIRPPGVKPYQEPKPTTKTSIPGGQAAPAETLKPGTTGTPSGEGKAAKTAPVNPTEATEAPAPGGKIDLETGAAPTEGVRSDFRPYDPENPEGYEPRLNAPAERRPTGFAPGDEHIHEWGHITNAALEGWGTEGIKSHLNADLPSKRTTAAATVIPKGIDWKDPDSIARNTGKMLSVVLGGGVANELHSGIPFEINKGIDSDVNLIKNTLRKGLGFTDDEIDAAIRYGRDRATRNLTQPGISDMMLQNSKVRESGLSREMHASPERTEAYAQEVRRIQDANRQPTTGEQPAGAGERPDQNGTPREVRGVNQPNDAGTKGTNEGTNPAGNLETGRGLKEHSTGDENRDAVIRSAGAVPAGVMFPGTDYEIKMFHDPETGSTLGFKPSEAVTPEAVKQKLAESREQFGVKAGADLETGRAKDEESKYHPDLQKVLDISGPLHQNPAKLLERPAFITPDGKISNLPAGKQHPEIISAATGESHGDGADNRPDFLDRTGAVRVRFHRQHPDNTMAYSIPKTGVTPEEMDMMRQGVGQAGRYGNLTIERSDVNYNNMKDTVRSKEFARPSDVDDMLREIGAHPDQRGMDLETGKSDEDRGPNLDEFHEKKGLPAPEPTNVPVDKQEGAKIADAYDAMRHAPNDPAVKASYDALKHDTLKQWNELKKQGVKMTVTDDPDYYQNAEEMLRDIKDNKHIAVWSGEGDMPKDHPLREIEPSTGLPYNTLFRGVHDVLGHGVGSNDFSEQGEENAYNLHRQSYSPEAIPALATETKGQANWVFNNKALRESGGQPSEFPTQKAALLPEEFHGANPWAHKAAEYAKEGGFTIDPRNGEVPNKGYQVEAAPDVRVDLDHSATPADIQKFYNDNKQIFDEHPEMKVGGFGKELNASASTDSRANAEALGKKLDQISIWDVKNGKEIPTGGTGKTTSFPDYPLEQRMADLRAKPGIDLETGKGEEFIENLTPVKQWDVVRDPDGAYHYVNHEAKLMSAGFGSRDGLERNADIIRVDKATIPLMQKRYLGESPEPRFRSKAAQQTKTDAHEGLDKLDTRTTSPLQTLDTAATTGTAVTTKPVKQWDIVRDSDGTYRYVNHEAKLMSAGFGSREALEQNAEAIRVDKATIPLMQKRYLGSPHRQGKYGIDLETGAGVAEPEEETGDTSFNFGANEPGSQQLSPPYNAETSQRVSSRFPTAVNATENPLEHQLTLDHELIHNNPAVAQRLADKIVKQNKSMVFSPEEIAAGPKGIFDSFIRQAKDNIKSVYERARQAGNHVSDRIWYDGAHDFTKTDAEANGMSHAQAAGVLATQSPQKDWDANVSLYNRIVDIVKNKGDVVMTPEMEKKGAEFIKQINASNRVKVAKGKAPAAPWVERKLLNSFKNKSFDEITNPMEKAAWLRLYDEAHNDRGFNELHPDGSVVGPRRTLGGSTEKVAWGGLDSIAKAIKIMQDGSLENISRNLGENHKVRSFYNNIIEPNSPHRDVTADTHHVGLSLMRPVAGSDPETTLNFSGNKSIVSGVRGTYPLYAEATRQAMDEINAEHPDDPPIEYPRQLQSVTWVEWRKMFPPETRTPATKAAVNSIWKEHLDGQITADEARQKISDYAARLRSGVDEGESSPANEGELPAHQLHGAGDSRGSGGRGPGRVEVQTRSRSLKPQSDKPLKASDLKRVEGFREIMRQNAGTQAGQQSLGEK